MTEESEKRDLGWLRGYMKSNKKDYYRDPRQGRSIVSTGFHSLDELLKGGLRPGTYIELFGEESTGKTYLSLNFMRQCQEAFPDKPVCYMELENAWDPDRAEFIGVDIDPERCEVVSPPNQEEAYNYLKAAIKNDIFSIIIIDSVSGMSPAVEIEEEVQKEQVAKAARVNSKGMRNLTTMLKNTIVVLINQQREKIGVMFGDPKVTTGGNSIKFYAHMRLQCVKLKKDPEDREVYSAKTGKMEKEKVPTGHIMKLKLVKSKFGNNDKTTQLVYSYEQQEVDRVEDRKSILTQKGLLWREGTQMYYLKGREEGIRGKQGLYDFIRDNEEFVEELIRGDKGE